MHPLDIAIALAVLIAVLTILYLVISLVKDAMNRKRLRGKLRKMKEDKQRSGSVL